MSKALQTQVGGMHYKQMPTQPWEIIASHNLDFWEGNVLKYVLRYRTKNGVEDLKKARHYLDYLIERESSMYTIKRVKGKVPVSLQGTFMSYNEARSALRKWFKAKFPDNYKSQHPTMLDIQALGGFYLAR